MNLKNETIEALKYHGKSVEDVIAVCGVDFQIPLDNFWQLADTEYDNGYGGQEVASDLRIIGKDFLMVRHEYDGSECWRFFSTVPPENVENACCLTYRQAKNLRNMIMDEYGFPIDDDVMSDGSLKDYNTEAKGGSRYDK